MTTPGTSQANVGTSMPISRTGSPSRSCRLAISSRLRTMPAAATTSQARPASRSDSKARATSAANPIVPSRALFHQVGRLPSPFMLNRDLMRGIGVTYW